MAQSSQRKANRKPSQQPARKAAPERSAAPPAADRPLLPGATLVWVLLAGATLWFAGQMWALRGTLSAVVENVELGPDAITALVTFGLPTVISSAVVLGAATGLGVAVLLSGRFEDTRVVRLATAAGAGLLAAGVAGSALYASGYGTAAPIGVGVAALLGGLISGVPARVLAAGVAGALTVAVVHFVTALFTSSLRGLLDGAGTGREMAGANSLLGMLISLLAGVAAGVVSYLVLRRHRPVGLVGHLAAGAAAGVFLLVAEVVSRLTLMSVIRESGGMVWDEVWLLQRIAEARLSGGLLILFAGAIAGLIALGRAKPRTPAKQFKPRQPPASGGTTEAGTKPAAKAKPAAKGGTEPAAD